ncbi:MAG: hypothetical protein A2521_10030 [Deltaproteobacteria bacterium RIFOXYD12_FULL_57_12]|nr:MAG: hypothetical protein A2521_10030 [Deltaproteobacteria bacterium RIFOXYD12_FULL_57_12]
MFSAMHHFSKHAASADLAIVFLPGLGFDGRIIRLVAPKKPAWIHPDTLLDPDTLVHDLRTFLDREGIRQIALVGWSMGGYLALDFARAYPEAVRQLTLVSIRRQWPAAEIRHLRAALTTDPAGFLTEFYRKCFIGHRSAFRVFAAGLQREYLQNLTPATVALLQRGLDYVAQADNRPIAGINTLLIHGRQDIISPVNQMPDTNDTIAVELLNNCGHLPFLARQCSLVQDLQKEKIRKKFSRAAVTYDSHALIQQETARQMAELAAKNAESAPFRNILELGCGTGNYTRMLAERFPTARILAIDFSEEMLAAARVKLAAFSNTVFLRADCERYLEMACCKTSESWHLITANGTLQWFSNIEKTLTNISRLLAADGLFTGTIFGPRTLEELGRGVSQVFGRKIDTAAEFFIDKTPLRRILANSFTVSSLREHSTIKQYKSCRHLLDSIRKTGTGGWHQAEPPVFTRARLTQLDRWFQDNCDGCRTTYQTFMLHGANRSILLKK